MAKGEYRGGGCGCGEYSEIFSYFSTKTYVVATTQTYVVGTH